MTSYFLTAFEKDSQVALNERIDAETDEEAIEAAKQKLEESKAMKKTHRLTKNGKLLLFAR
ncbi:YhzD family protein [Shouchella shacheensis]|uniref:YhzD family protein n=1 Tax=Shouchella shacheensis TaxID=1649580 RepID=UPI00073FF459|nr:YhzD family protein [Shouchella shacheensis]